MAVLRDDYLVAGVFRDRDSADRAFDAAAACGVDRDRISVVMKDATREKYYGEVQGKDYREHSRAAEGAGKGGAWGAGIGAAIMAVLAAGAPVTIAGLLVAGPIAGVIAGAGGGSVAGGIIGALIGSGMKEKVAKEYGAEIEKGYIALAVTVHDEADARSIQKEWRKYGEKVRRVDLPGSDETRKTA